MNLQNIFRTAAVATLLTFAAMCCAQTTPNSTPSGAKPPAKPAQKPKQIVRVEEESTDKGSPELREAETALAAKDFTKAEQLLLPYTQAHPADYLGWYDLSFVYLGKGQNGKAVDALKHSVTLKGDIFESNLRLGTLLCMGDQTQEALPYLRKATQLKPETAQSDGPFQAWMLLGRASVEKDPKEALAAARKAGELDAKSADPHLLAAEAAMDMKDAATGEAEFKLAQALDPKSAVPVAGLVAIYIGAHRDQEAETALRTYLEMDPEKTAARRQLAHLLARNGKKEEALEQLKRALQSEPANKDLLQDIAAVDMDLKKYTEAMPILEDMVKASPKDASLHADLGHALLMQLQYVRAEEELLAAMRIDEKLPQAAYDLALAAEENKHYKLALIALDAHARVATVTPYYHFLRAISYDNLQMYKDAALSYHKFLSVAGGKYPTQEWQAQHRLLAIEPKN